MDKIFEFDKIDGILEGYTEEIKKGLRRNNPKYDKYKDLVIPSEIDGIKVKRIDGEAFKENNLTSVNIPDNIVEIGDGAFERNNLFLIQLSKNIKIINKWTFYDNQLTSVNIPEGVEIIEMDAFKNNHLTEIFLAEETKYKFWDFGFWENAFDEDVKIIRRIFDKK